MLIPLQCETLSHRGVGQLLDTVHDVRRFTNRELEVWGVLPTLYDGRTNHARAVLETISETYDLEVIEPPIPKSIRFAEAPAAGRSILSTVAHQQGRRGLPRRSPRTSSDEADRAMSSTASNRRRRVRPRVGRIAAAGVSLAVTEVALLGGHRRDPDGHLGRLRGKAAVAASTSPRHPG